MIETVLAWRAALETRLATQRLNDAGLTVGTSYVYSAQMAATSGSSSDVFGQAKNVDAGEPLLPPHPSLTPRQAEVLQLLEDGSSTEQIARALHLSTETVRNHIRHILRALNAHSRLEAVAIGRREHLAAN